MATFAGATDVIPRSQLDALIREAIDQHGGQKQLAQSIGVSQTCISDVYRGYREPGERLLTALGYRKVILYERVES